MKEKGIKSIIGKMGILLALIVVCVFLAIVTKGQFVTFNNILRQTPIVALMAVGMLCVILLGGIDLSAGSMLAFSSCCAGVLMQNFGINNSFILIVACLLVGILCGAFNGVVLLF